MAVISSKNKRVLALLLLGMVWGGGCNNKTKLPAKETIIIIDTIGRKVEVPKKVKRIVCRGPGVLRLITYLEATDKVVAIESGFEKDSSIGRPYIIAHPELANLPTIGAASPSPQPNPEAIINVRPEVIFISYVEPRIANDLQEKTEIPVVVLSYGELATFDNQYIFNSLRIAAKIINKENRAEKVINFIRNCQKDLRNRTNGIPADKKPGVYVGGLGFKGTHGITSTECRYPAFELLHAKNVADELGKAGHIFIDKEKIIEWNPDIIFIDASGLNLTKDDYRKNPKFYNLLKAVQNEKLYGLFPYNYYTTNIDTALADAYYIGKVVYPEKFKNIEPDKKANEIYKFLVGKPIYNRMKNDWEGFKKISLSKKINDKN
ncbi:MAG: iron ABC transporter substrate-binding protein [Candidatus Theseobacter exili]|nr:iron ABC transporter substrate-binding protein [Candidatus Theseobacter exili]